MYPSLFPLSERPLPQERHGVGGLLWDDAVTEDAEALGASEVQPSGQPISHSTNAGLQRGREVGPVGEDGAPGDSVSGARGKLTT